MWEPVNKAFMKDVKPYGPGDFRIRDDRVISMKLAQAETSNKPMTPAQVADPDFVPQYTEAWMWNPGERLNRATIEILMGPADGPVESTFKEHAQYGDWWLSPDWQTIYLASQWLDYTVETPPGQDVIPTQKLWKSIDGGDNWQRLDWPEQHNITFLRFLDAQRGYLIGWGPRVWRTQDGGGHWQEIDVPMQARSVDNPREQFDLVALGEDGVLRFAFFAERHGELENTSLVYALPWDTTTPELAFTAPDQTVIDLLADKDGKVFVLGWKGLPVNHSIPGDSERVRPSIVSHWDGRELRELHEFDEALTGYALYRTPAGHLLFDGVGDGVLPNDVMALSTDGGESWDVQDEGGSAQGGYYDTGTGIRWRVSGYTLSKRAIP